MAGFVREEEIIYNLQHKLHSNGPALSAAWQRVATKMGKSGKYFQFILFNRSKINSIEILVYIVLVADCKVMYKSMRDAKRYRDKKIGGKSGDSGDENLTDDTSQDNWELKDALSFLTPTSSRFARKTMVMGGGASTESSPSTFNPIEEDESHDRSLDKLLFESENEPSSQSSVYSFVSNFYRLYFFVLNSIHYSSRSFFIVHKFEHTAYT